MKTPPKVLIGILAAIFFSAILFNAKASQIQSAPTSALTSNTGLLTSISIGAILLKDCVCAYVDTISESDLILLSEHFANAQDIPRQFDGKLLATTRDRLGRDLDGTERGQIRSILVAEVRVRVSVPQQ